MVVILHFFVVIVILWLFVCYFMVSCLLVYGYLRVILWLLYFIFLLFYDILWLCFVILWLGDCYLMFCWLFYGYFCY